MSSRAWTYERALSVLVGDGGRSAGAGGGRDADWTVQRDALTTLLHTLQAGTADDGGSGGGDGIGALLPPQLQKELVKPFAEFCCSERSALASHACGVLQAIAQVAERELCHLSDRIMYALIKQTGSGNKVNCRSVLNVLLTLVRLVPSPPMLPEIARARADCASNPQVQETVARVLNSILAFWDDVWMARVSKEPAGELCSLLFAGLNAGGSTTRCITRVNYRMFAQRYPAAVVAFLKRYHGKLPTWVATIMDAAKVAEDEEKLATDDTVVTYLMVAAPPSPTPPAGMDMAPLVTPGSPPPTLMSDTSRGASTWDGEVAAPSTGSGAGGASSTSAGHRLPAAAPPALSAVPASRAPGSVRASVTLASPTAGGSGVTASMRSPVAALRAPGASARGSPVALTRAATGGGGGGAGPSSMSAGTSTAPGVSAPTAVRRGVAPARVRGGSAQALPTDALPAATARTSGSSAAAAAQAPGSPTPRARDANAAAAALLVKRYADATAGLPVGAVAYDLHAHFRSHVGAAVAGYTSLVQDGLFKDMGSRFALAKKVAAAAAAESDSVSLDEARARALAALNGMEYVPPASGSGRREGTLEPPSATAERDAAAQHAHVAHTELSTLVQRMREAVLLRRSQCDDMLAHLAAVAQWMLLPTNAAASSASAVSSAANASARSLVSLYSSSQASPHVSGGVAGGGGGGGGGGGSGSSGSPQQLGLPSSPGTARRDAGTRSSSLSSSELPAPVNGFMIGIGGRASPNRMLRPGMGVRAAAAVDSSAAMSSLASPTAASAGVRLST